MSDDLTTSLRKSLEVSYSGDPSTLVSLIEFESLQEKRMQTAEKTKQKFFMEIIFSAIYLIY